MNCHIPFFFFPPLLVLCLLRVTRGLLSLRSWQPQRELAHNKVKPRVHEQKRRKEKNVLCWDHGGGWTLLSERLLCFALLCFASLARLLCCK